MVIKQVANCYCPACECLTVHSIHEKEPARELAVAFCSTCGFKYKFPDGSIQREGGRSLEVLIRIPGMISPDGLPVWRGNVLLEVSNEKGGFFGNQKRVAEKISGAVIGDGPRGDKVFETHEHGRPVLRLLQYYATTNSGSLSICPYPGAI